MNYVICYKDSVGTTWYFSQFGLWNLPVWVAKSQIFKARRFETKSEATQWKKEFLKNSSRYDVVKMK